GNFALLGIAAFLALPVFRRLTARPHGEQSGQPARPRPQCWELAWVPLMTLLVFGAFMAGKYVFSDAVRLYLLGMAELQIDDFHHDEFEQFIVTSDTSPEFVKGFSFPPHVPLFVEPGKYRIKAVGKNHV